MSKVLVVGSGAFGTAISSVLMHNNHEVNIYGIDDTEINDLKQGYNRKFFNDFKLDKIPHLVTNDFKLAVKDVEFIFIAIPSKTIRSFLEKYKQDINQNIIIVNAAKGIDQISNQNYLEVIKSILKHNQVASIAGPTFAIDLLQKNYSASNIIANDRQVAEKILNLVSTDYFKLKINQDEIATSIYSSLKNALAIGSGFLFAQQYSINTISAFINMGLDEINQYVLMKHGKENTIFSFCAIGDTFLTCFSNKSRNFSFGYNLAHQDIEQLLKQNITVEGLNAINNLYNEIKDLNNFIVFKTLYQLVNNQIDKNDFIKIIWKQY